MTDALDGLVVVDGRQVAYCLYGREARHRTLFHYGTPGVRWLSPQLIAAADRADTAMLVVDRPGYGGSDRRPGRRVVDVVDDVAAVLAAVGWEQCAVWGGSGGGPHALAVAARLADRVSRCASVVGLAPPDAPGLAWYAGMSLGNVEEFEAADAGEQRYRPLVERLAREAVAAVERGGVQVADGSCKTPISTRSTRGSAAPSRPWLTSSGRRRKPNQTDAVVEVSISRLAVL